MLLSIETATNVCSVAFRDREGKQIEKRTNKRGSHSELLFLFIEELMEEHGLKIPELEGVLVSKGPGSYTGLRISASAVKGLLFQTQVPLYAVDTLASYAMQAATEREVVGTIHSVIDARRQHLYHQKFQWEQGALRTYDQTEVRPIDNVEKMIEAGDIVVGTGLKRLDAEVRDKATLLDSHAITARSLIDLYEAEAENFFKQVDPESFDPSYYTSSQVQ
ncbi:tRNA (adenosine(37)-N6)-threonylcarbamoyltransferase complex dimerization subunit type 1 TsaB [Aliifodinibius salicampi]|uniref:tRNA (Adenosine(37)-N6)-threonylcarbamoyltransferase complex dimerization subunit type 1 TsaB n=1 Tax=Fodinibius salicampi TaxID=1920655 RepID=A0ABT3Q1Q8_9BACT|nr:tRNA (adenosine(37)-N6)-threonylcarbamoyltransferase complex dimerization subunit type 1 TsaB [Fodinibius salicampi]